MTRKDFLRLMATIPVALLFRPETASADSEHPYIAQPTQITCGFAVMAMLTAQVKNEDVYDVYERVQKYFEMVGRYDVLLGGSALEDYLERKESIPIKSSKIYWDIDLLQEQIASHGSTIACVTTNYSAVVPNENPANHWVLVDAISEIDNKPYILVRDPLRSTEEYKAIKQPTQDMIPVEDGSIYIPAEMFISATGDNYLYIDDELTKKSFQKRYSSVKFK